MKRIYPSSSDASGRFATSKSSDIDVRRWQIASATSI
jgi:hypothetical protein